MPNLAAAALMVLGAALAAQDPQPPGAGFGAVYRRFACDAQTGAATHLGVAVGANGRFYVSAARTAAASQHLVYEFDG
ncbi:MAG: hypothetical protein RL398_2886, partial [Planctomycetota bacterium]